MVSDWDTTTRLEGTVVFYTCLAGLQTPDGLTVQNQTCTANGWVGTGAGEGRTMMTTGRYTGNPYLKVSC